MNFLATLEELWYLFTSLGWFGKTVVVIALVAAMIDLIYYRSGFFIRLRRK